MTHLLPYLGDLHKLFDLHWSGTILVFSSVLCGLMIGQERESKQKPAGLRTVALICVGSTIFTLASILIAADAGSDPGRIAAQVVTGISFLGAGAIIRERGTIVGLTTGATIWVTSAIGVLIGSGYAAGGIALTLVVLAMSRGAQILEQWTSGPCRLTSFNVRYDPKGGRTQLRLVRILDEYRIPDANWTISAEAEHEVVRIRCCTVHRSHRAVVFEIAGMPEVIDISPGVLSCSRQILSFAENESGGERGRE
ncbi:MAG TPA: MgtC/SapB family protein [Phycisphaerae bacterium]|nr:MgtC/SapB family protein [Phycisphaerae bacterium]